MTDPGRWPAAFDVEILGNPVGFVRARTNKRGVTHVDKRVTIWKRSVRAQCAEALQRAGWSEPVPIGVPLFVELVFRFPRPRGHYRKAANGDALRPDAPIVRPTAPDKDNLEKPVLDTLGEFVDTQAARRSIGKKPEPMPPLLWSNDAQIVTGPTTKRYVNEGEAPGCWLSMRVLTDSDIKEIAMRGLSSGNALEPLPEVSPPLSPGEALEIQRQRNRLTLQEAAALFDVSTGRYRAWETDRNRAGPVARVARLKRGEWCFIQRRRLGLQSGEMRSLVGMPGTWVLSAEREDVNCEPLVSFWLRYLKAMRAG